MSRGARTYRWIVFAGVPLVACNAILGIHDPEIEAPREAGAADSGSDSAPSEDARTDAPIESDAGIDVDAGRCPTKGGAMVEYLPFCIDATEVTVAAYKAFLDAGGPMNVEGCGYKTAASPIQEDKPQHPIAYVDWCDAKAFCAWAGKHLCGSVAAGDGGSHALPLAQANSVTQSEWMAACSDRGKRAYAYGPTEDASACNTNDAGGSTEPVGSRATCQGSVPGLFDMSGNVWEWIDACDEPDGAPQGTPCRFMGPGYMNIYPCNVVGGLNRAYVAADVGFRCCF